MIALFPKQFANNSGDVPYEALCSLDLHSHIRVFVPGFCTGEPSFYGRRSPSKQQLQFGRQTENGWPSLLTFTRIAVMTIATRRKTNKPTRVKLRLTLLTASFFGTG